MKNSIWLLLFLGAFAVAGIYWYYGSAEKNQSSAEPSASESANQNGVFVPNDPPPVAGGLPGARDERPSYPSTPPQNTPPQSPPSNQYPGYTPPAAEQGFQPPPPAFDAPQYEPPPYEPPPYDQVPPPPPPQRMDEFDNDPVSPPPPMEPPSFGGEGDYQPPPQPMEEDL